MSANDRLASLPLPLQGKRSPEQLLPIYPGGFPGLTGATRSGLTLLSFTPNNLPVFPERKSGAVIIHLGARLSCFQRPFSRVISFHHLGDLSDMFNWFFEDSWVSRANLFKQNTSRKGQHLELLLAHTLAVVGS